MNLVATRWWSMLFMPSCVLMAGIAVGLAWCLWSWRRGKAPRQAWPAVALAAGSAFLLYLASTPLVARWAAWTLEREVPAIAVERLPVADAIVVLGGSMYATQREDGSVHLYAKHAGDRFDTALAAYRAGRAPLMVFGGGGTLGVPLLSLLGYPIRAAVATASAFGVIIAIPATIGLIWGGWSDPRVPPFSLGYVSLIGFALIAPTSIIATPWGVKLAHSIPPLVLKRAFAVFLAITSARMFWSIFT